jgi:hypothetical protein
MRFIALSNISAEDLKLVNATMEKTQKPISYPEIP